MMFSTLKLAFYTLLGANAILNLQKQTFVQLRRNFRSFHLSYFRPTIGIFLFLGRCEFTRTLKSLHHLGGLLNFILTDVVGVCIEV